MKNLLVVLAACFLLIACGDSEKIAKTVSTEPTETIIKENKGKEFSIVLDDMQIKEETSLITYQHKYSVLTVENDSLHAKNTTWKDVNQSFFVKHENDLGMEIISNHNNKLTRIAQPVGFGWAVGNEKHGEWEAVQKDSTSTASSSNNNNRRWRTNSSSFFFWYWLGSRRSTYRNDYSTYSRYHNSGQPYYGSNRNGGYNYGTRSTYQKTKRSSFFARKKSNASTWNTHKTKRSSSRYSTGSSTRSRSGGFGK